METRQTALNLLQKGDCLVSADLNDACFSIPIHHQSGDVFEKIRGASFNASYSDKNLLQKIQKMHEASYVSPEVSSGIIYIDDSL